MSSDLEALRRVCAVLGKPRRPVVRVPTSLGRSMKKGSSRRPYLPTNGPQSDAVSVFVKDGGRRQFRPRGPSLGRPAGNWNAPDDAEDRVRDVQLASALVEGHTVGETVRRQGSTRPPAEVEPRAGERNPEMAERLLRPVSAPRQSAATPSWEYSRCGAGRRESRRCSRRAAAQNRDVHVHHCPLSAVASDGSTSTSFAVRTISGTPASARNTGQIVLASFA